MTQLIDHRSKILAHFKCQNSGNCCKTPGYVYVSQSDINAMANNLNLPVHMFKRFFVTRINGWHAIAGPNFRSQCFLSDDNLCEVYHSRPKKCRTYPDWDYIWENDESLIKESQACKGLANAIEIVTGC